MTPGRKPVKRPGQAMDSERRGLAVLDVVDAIPAGRVMTYGDIARFLGIASARQVGQVLARAGHEVPWHRVVMADGSAAPHHSAEQLRRLRVEGVTVVNRRVVLAAARWHPRAAGEEPRPGR